MKVNHIQLPTLPLPRKLPPDNISVQGSDAQPPQITCATFVKTLNHDRIFSGMLTS